MNVLEIDNVCKKCDYFTGYAKHFTKSDPVFGTPDILEVGFESRIPTVEYLKTLSNPESQISNM